jgi:PKD repeat protein
VTPWINVTSNGFLWLGYVLYISANLTDPNNDSINYSWDWGDKSPGMRAFVHSGDCDNQSHLYRDPGKYTITVIASTQKGGNSSSTINITVLSPKSPKTPSGERIAYVNESYVYSTSLDAGFLAKDALFLFDWCFDDASISTTGADILHKWPNNGTKKVKARALDFQGNPSNWSDEINVDVYEPKYVECNQDLQNIIDNVSNYTEIILNCNSYNVSKAILIKGKDHFSIRPRESHASLKNDKSVETIMQIDNSTCVNISGFWFEQDAYINNSFLRVYDCYYCNVNNCEFNISSNFFNNNNAIWIYKGGYNEINDNKIERGNIVKCFGILILDSCSNIIKNNTFHLKIRNNQFGHIGLHGQIDSNRIIKSNETDELKIVVGDCTFIWGSGNDGLDPKNGCSMDHQIKINKIELSFK